MKHVNGFATARTEVTFPNRNSPKLWSILERAIGALTRLMVSLQERTGRAEPKRSKADAP